MGTIEAPLFSVKKVNESHSFTASTSLAYTGVSYTIPANTEYELEFHIVYINNAPMEMYVSDSSSNSGVYTRMAGGDGVSGGYITGYTASAKTVYVWAKYNGAGTNRVDIGGLLKQYFEPLE